MRLIDADKLISEQDVYFDGNRTVKDIIDEQPTVRQWIPVSERLPEGNGILSSRYDNTKLQSRNGLVFERRLVLE